MTDETPTSWREVFDGSKMWHGLIDAPAELASQAGYKFLSWNGRIYKLSEDFYFDTGLLDKDLK